MAFAVRFSGWRAARVPGLAAGVVLEEAGLVMIQPGVLTGTGNSNESTHHLDAEPIPTRLNEPILSPGFAWSLVRRHGAGLQPQAQMLDLD